MLLRLTKIKHFYRHFKSSRFRLEWTGLRGDGGGSLPSPAGVSCSLRALLPQVRLPVRDRDCRGPRWAPPLTARTEASIISAARETARLVSSGSLERDRSRDGERASLFWRFLRHEGRHEGGRPLRTVVLVTRYSPVKQTFTGRPPGPRGQARVP